MSKSKYHSTTCLLGDSALLDAIGCSAMFYQVSAMYKTLTSLKMYHKYDL